MVGHLNKIASMVTCIACVTYAMVNLTCALLRLSGTPNFRPTFTAWSWRSALFGAVLNLAVVLFIRPITTVVLLLLVGGVFLYASHAGGDAKHEWGDVRQALLFHQVRKYLLQLSEESLGHAKNWRPSVLLLVTAPRPRLVRLCNALKKGGMFIVGEVVVGAVTEEAVVERARRRRRWARRFDRAHAKALPEVLLARTAAAGYETVIMPPLS
jgi:potassium/chloride transporter 9